MAHTVNVHEAKTHFSKLLARVAAGEEIIISKAGKPVARLSPVPPGIQGGKRTPGIDAGKFTVPDDFDRMSEEDLAEWYRVDELLLPSKTKP
jgi:prevent-host-death family protein